MSGSIKAEDASRDHLKIKTKSCLDSSESHP